jgi:hypothetical protein
MVGTARRSGSVDMLGPVCSVAARTLLRPEGLEEIERPLGPGHCYVLPRKEVIQPQLPLRLPCSRGSPCRHGAWTISSSWLSTTKTSGQQTALPWMPGSHAGYEIPLGASCNIEPPDRMICFAGRPMQLAANNPSLSRIACNLAISARSFCTNWM